MEKNLINKLKGTSEGLSQSYDICLTSVSINHLYLPLALSQGALKPLWSALPARRQQEVLLTLLDRSKVPFFCGIDIPAEKLLLQGDLSDIELTATGS